jgi:hypothetical protein
MMRGGQISRRLEYLDQTVGRCAMASVAEALAAQVGCTAGELLVEAEHIALQCQQQGITTWEEMLVWQAGQLGISVDDLTAEIAGIVP